MPKRRRIPADFAMLLRDNVYESLRADILSCRLAPGDDVREQDLAARYAVSRQPVREALLRLEREHLVTVQPRQGYRVNPISLSDARDLLRFRLALEPACVAEAIERAGDDALEALDDFREFSGDHEDFIAYNRAFHAALAHASGNRRMAGALCDLIMIRPAWSPNMSRSSRRCSGAMHEPRCG
jgi:GntR family transcriptional regulator, rspAB operon transcriptional repressor